MGFNKTLVLSGALEVMHAIKGTSDWSINSVQFDIKATSCLFYFINFLHIPRVFNQVAHECAKLDNVLSSGSLL